MEKYSRAVSEMYSRFERRKAYPMEKYIGRLVNFYGKRLEVVGYSHNELTGEPLLIVEALPFGGWSELEPSDVIFKECESYWYAGIDDLID
nr:MAG TPA: hypothetical protein [Caudoviricetes sp.]